MIQVLAAVCAIAAAYQLVALAAVLRHFFFAPKYTFFDGGHRPAVSILKPLRGADPHLYDALRSHLTQEYPQFEMLCGVRSLSDPAAPVVERLMAEFPASSVRLIVTTTDAPNPKVGTLIDLTREARYPVLEVNDADIIVPQGWLRHVVAPLSDAQTGLVTCVYRAFGSGFPARFEALGIATDFAPSTLVAPFVGISEFGLGATLAFRRADLEAIGGFEAIAPYLADDYQLGAQIHRLGRRNRISRVVVATRLGAQTWSDAWRHQVRWARTIRLSRGAYAGLPVTFATLWALITAACGHLWLAVPLLAIRLIMAVTAGWFGLRSADVLRLVWLIPIRDLWGSAVWAAGLVGNQVRWGDRAFRLDRRGRIVPN